MTARENESMGERERERARERDKTRERRDDGHIRGKLSTGDEYN